MKLRCQCNFIFLLISTLGTDKNPETNKIEPLNRYWLTVSTHLKKPLGIQSTVRWKIIS